MIANNPRLTDVGSAANRQRAIAAGRQQAVLARMALAALQSQRPAAHRDRGIRALQHRISNPDGALAELGQTMTPPMTKHGTRRCCDVRCVAVGSPPTTDWAITRGVRVLKRLIGRAAVWVGHVGVAWVHLYASGALWLVALSRSAL